MMSHLKPICKSSCKPATPTLKGCNKHHCAAHIASDASTGGRKATARCSATNPRFSHGPAALHIPHACMPPLQLRCATPSCQTCTAVHRGCAHGTNTRGADNKATHQLPPRMFYRATIRDTLPCCHCCGNASRLSLHTAV